MVDFTDVCGCVRKDIVPIGETESPSGKRRRQVRRMKDGKVMTDEENVLRIWKEYYNTE